MVSLNSQVRSFFRPELLNRLDEIVVFEPLSPPQLRQVAKMQMRQVAVRLVEKNISLAVTDSALDFVLSQAYDPVSFPVTYLFIYFFEILVNF